MKLLIFLLIIPLFFSCKSSSNSDFNIEKQEAQINAVLNSWHNSASEANFEKYFEVMDEKSVFFGTDASENWTKEEFQSFSKPHFEKGKAWSFKAFDRNIYFSKMGNVAWFDELLETWMGTCVGSGVLEISNGEWKIKHYVLSVAIPNDDMQEVIDIKHKNDSIFKLNK